MDDKLRIQIEEMLRIAESGDWNKCLKTAKRVLGIYQDNDTAIICKVVCWLKLGKFDEVLAFTENHPDIARLLTFEKAYAEYRLGKLDESLKTLVNCDSKRERLLLGQVLYKLGRFDECEEVYVEAMKSVKNSDRQNEILTNLLASKCALDLGSEPPGKPENSLNVPETVYNYELMFNKALLLMVRRHYMDAEKAFYSALESCKKVSTEEEYSEEETNADLNLIRVPYALSLQLQGKVKEAKNVYEMIENTSTDAMVSAIAGFNSGLMVEQNAGDWRKKLKPLGRSSRLYSKLSLDQKWRATYNEAVVDILTDQTNNAMKQLEMLDPSKYPHLLASLQISAMVRQRNYEDALLAMRKLSNDNKLSVDCAKILTLQGKFAEAASILAENNQTGDWDHLIFQLLSKSGDSERMRAYLIDELEPKSGSDVDGQRMIRLVSMMLKYGRPEDIQSADCLKKLEKQLQAIDLQQMAKGFDVDTLEDYHTRHKRHATSNPTAGKSKDQELTDAKKKRRRKRKTKLPANYDPSQPPDPERWLPLKERSYYRRKRKQRHNPASKTTQGVAAPQSDRHYFATTQTGTAVPRVGSVAPPPSATKQRGSKKRRRGGKW